MTFDAPIRLAPCGGESALTFDAPIRLAPCGGESERERKEGRQRKRTKHNTNTAVAENTIRTQQ